MKRYAVVEAYNELPHSGKMDNSAKNISEIEIEFLSELSCGYNR